MTRVTGSCAFAEGLGSRHPYALVEVSRRDRAEPTPDPCPHAVRATLKTVVGLDPHAECSMLHALTERCACGRLLRAHSHRSTGEARIDMPEPPEHAQTHDL